MHRQSLLYCNLYAMEIPSNEKWKQIEINEDLTISWTMHSSNGICHPALYLHFLKHAIKMGVILLICWWLNDTKFRLHTTFLARTTSEWPKTILWNSICAKNQSPQHTSLSCKMSTNPAWALSILLRMSSISLSTDGCAGINDSNTSWMCFRSFFDEKHRYPMELKFEMIKIELPVLFL